MHNDATGVIVAISYCVYHHRTITAPSVDAVSISIRREFIRYALCFGEDHRSGIFPASSLCFSLFDCSSHCQDRSVVSILAFELCLH